LSVVPHLSLALSIEERGPDDLLVYNLGLLSRSLARKVFLVPGGAAGRAAKSEKNSLSA
jgi:hypothetical protein